ncbi:MAG: SpoIIE family protein phosphatase [Candidatus Latescibacteria bacterium]|nr:SpoIIE family protein phosphatase [Candidatus Latescibacterota bacterium]
MLRVKGQRPVLWILVLLVQGLPLRVQAHNGARAIAVPVVPEYGISPRDASDFQGWFRVGYNARENALYVAVEVQDESTMVDAAAGDFYARDGCDVYVDVRHQDRESPAVQYVMLGQELQWYGAGARAEDARIVVHRGDGRHRYEWRLDVGGLSGGSAHLVPGTVIGLDVVVNDADRGGQFSWMAWGKGINKVTITGNRGDAVLVAADGGTGTLRVRGTREGGGPAAGSKIRVRFVAAAGQWVDLVTDREGVGSVELPAGQYRVAPLSAREASGEGVAVALEAGSAAEAEVVVPPLRGITVTAGKGRLVTSGPGTRQGPWLTYDATDGLPSTLVIALCPDGHGGLWVGGAQGVSHFDGARFHTLSVVDGLRSNEVSSIAVGPGGRLWFGSWREGVSRLSGQVLTTFTAEDGLAGNMVWAVLEDRQGHLWISADGGVSRYDGQGFTTYTTADGLAGSGQAILEDRQGNLWFGSWAGGVSRYDGQGFTTYTTADGLASNTVLGIAEDQQGNLWFATDKGASRYDGHRFTTYTTADGLVGGELRCAAADGQRGVWFGSDGGGVSRWDGQRFATFTARDGLAAGSVRAIVPDGQGGMWFGTNFGLSRYDGAWITSFTAADGLAEDQAFQPLEDRQGFLWFRGDRGVSRYDGSRFASFTTGKELPGRFVTALGADIQGNVWVGTAGPGNFVSRHDGHGFTTLVLEDQFVSNQISGDRAGNVWFATWGGGLSRFDGRRVHTLRQGNNAGGWVHALAEDRDGSVWLGTEGGGAWRYDGAKFSNYTRRDGLASDTVFVIYQDRRDGLWFGTSQGLSRFDGSRFATFSTGDSLAGDWVRAILEDQQGNLWVATDKGAARYDGHTFVRFTVRDGLVHDDVAGILEDRDGCLWFCTAGGVSRYDGRVFQRFRRQDGLVHNGVMGILQDRSGDMWIATVAGVTRYRSRSEPPRIEVTDVVADRRYGSVPELRLPSSQELVAFEFVGASLTSSPGQMAYLYRLAGHDPDWRVTRESRVEYAGLPVGNYTFQAKAVDRDLNYSDPVSVRLVVHPPYGQIVLVGGLAAALIGLVLVGGYALRKRHALFAEMAEELQTAHTLQMGLMPREAPQLPGFDLAGRCIPANHVGGDLFQYFQQGGKLSIALADVTGHAMEAAIPMVMFSGVLKSQLENSGPIEELFGRLNRSLHNAAGSRTFVCFAFGTIDTRTSTLCLSSAAFPYPYHFSVSTGEIVELQIDAYPLGVRPDTRYAAIERQLGPGDYLVFCSDGIIEATDVAGAQFGYERTAATLRSGCAAGLSAAALLERIVAEVTAFRGETPQGDDQTVVVLKVEDRRSA